MTRKRSLGYNPLAEDSTDATPRDDVGKSPGAATDEIPKAVAIVLSGLGAEASAEAGVLEVLFAGGSPATGKVSLEPRLIVGSSFGAFNAALLAAHWRKGHARAVDELTTAWRERLADSSQRPGNGVFRFRGDPLDLMNPVRWMRRPLEPFVHLAGDSAFLARDWLSRGLSFALSSAPLSDRVFDLPDLTTLVSTSPFTRALEQTVKPADLKASALEVVVVAADWESGRRRLFRNAELAASDGHGVLRGAVALPGILPAVEIGGGRWLGGTATAGPIAPAVERGAAEIHVVEPTADPDGSETQYSTLEVLEQSARRQARSMLEQGLARIDLSNQVARQEGRPPIVVHRHHPQVERKDTLSVLDFSPGRIDSAIEEGRRVATRHDCDDAGCLGIARS